MISSYSACWRAASLSRCTSSIRAIRSLRSDWLMKMRRPQAPHRCRVSRSAQHFVLLEPADHPVPSVVSGVFAIAGAIIGDKTVRRARIDMEFGSLTVGLERGLHLMDLIDRNPAIRFAVKTEHRLLNL